MSVDGGDESELYAAVKDSEGGLAAAYRKNSDKKVQELEIPATVSVKGVELDVVEISESALAKHKRLKKVLIGENVESIKANAFKSCRKLKSISFETELLDSSKVADNAFKGIRSKCKMYVPDSEYGAAYKKWLKKKGCKKVRVLTD